MTPRQDILDYYARPASMTAPGAYAPMLDALPDDMVGLTGIVQGLAIHEYVASSFYGVTIPEERKSESHIRPVDRMIERLLAIDPPPLSVRRPPQKRLVGVCHHFALFLVAMLRAHGVPARARCGFGSYFNPGFYEDHWLCEYWNAPEGRWVLVDPQFDEIWRKQLKIEHDVLDVPRDRFLIAADAWTECRNGRSDPAKFGIFKGDLRGLWFIANDLVHDLAALNKMEMLPWDVWGGMPKPNEKLGDEQLSFFDGIAELTRAPDSWFSELRESYQNDERLRVPKTVFNAILNRPEPVSA